MPAEGTTQEGRQPARRDIKIPSGKLGVGSILDGRFALKELISDRGMAMVFKAEDLADNGRAVVIKTPQPNIEVNIELFARFQREEDMGASLQHPSILKFLAVKNKSRPYLAMEYLEGETLYHVLHRRRLLPEAEALSIAAQLCDALGYIHEQGIVHRDLKPENVMLCRDGSMRLMDFGIALYPDAKRLTFAGGFAPGTPHYMAPERIDRKRGDARTDIYSLGAMLYQMLTGVIAFDHEDISVIMSTRVTGDPEAPRRVRPEVSEPAEEIVLHAMERDPERRYASAAEMKAELLEPAKVALTGRWRRLEPSTFWRRARRHGRTIFWWAIVPMLAQVLLFLWLWHHLAKKK